METVRLRMVFDHILSKLLNTQGLKRCWILLKPQHQTISDLSSYILDAFNLHNHCPHGLLLSMEGFALPEFESTSILKDKDILSVEKNGGLSSELVTVGDEVNALEVVEFVETQPVACTGVNLLANEEFEKESGGYQSEEEEEHKDVPKREEEIMHVDNAPETKSVSKKRKATKEHKSSKNKRTKSATAEKRLAVVEDMENNDSGKQNGTLSTVKVDERSESSEALLEAKRFSLPQEDGAGVVASGTKKVPSRSARRKKAKRRWLREKLRAEREEQHQRQLRGSYNKQSSGKDNHRVFQESARNGNQDFAEVIPSRDDEKHQEGDQQPDKGSDLEDDVFPTVIRPGHIRFGSLSKVGADQAVPQTQTPVETFEWNGISSKKKGQKWGKAYKSNDYKARSSIRNDYKSVNQEHSKMQHTGARMFSHLDFDKLEFYTTLPKVGDVIAYRVIELSASWTPELTSYRVGKITRYDMHSNKVRLVQVPRYPVIFEKRTSEDGSSAPPETTPYAKDGSLWIEFSSLMEVRTVTQVDSNSVKSDAGGINQLSACDQDNRTGSLSNNGNATHASGQGNGKVDAWEEINKALDAKKAKLAQVDNWNKSQSSGNRPWSYKALRGSAMGPKRATLISRKEL